MGIIPLPCLMLQIVLALVDEHLGLFVDFGKSDQIQKLSVELKQLPKIHAKIESLCKGWNNKQTHFLF